MEQEIKIGRYRHFKGNEYEVIVERDGKVYQRFTYIGE